jgi:hypothetical protein
MRFDLPNLPTERRWPFQFEIARDYKNMTFDRIDFEAEAE